MPSSLAELRKDAGNCGIGCVCVCLVYLYDKQGKWCLSGAVNRSDLSPPEEHLAAGLLMHLFSKNTRFILRGTISLGGAPYPCCNRATSKHPVSKMKETTTCLSSREESTFCDHSLRYKCPFVRDRGTCS